VHHVERLQLGTTNQRKGQDELILLTSAASQLVPSNEAITSIQVTLRTTKGDLDIELWAKEAPKVSKMLLVSNLGP
jgi:hypothetical protein